MTVLQPNGPFCPTNLSVPLPPTALASAGPPDPRRLQLLQRFYGKTRHAFRSLTLQSPQRNNLHYDVRLFRYSLFLQKQTEDISLFKIC